MDEYGKEMNRFHTGDDKLNKMLRLDDNTVITGDDSGCVKIWDLRVDNNKLTANAAMEWHVHEDYVSSFLHVPEKENTLLSGSGDGTLAIYDLRKPSAANTLRSEDQEAEITCIEVMKNGKKVVCGTQDGVMLIFSWGKWLDQSDRYPGHPETVDCCLKIDEKTLLTGSSDGLIRALQIQPNKLMGVLGSHEDFPVEGMKKNHDETLIASFAHDPIIRFNDISIFYEGDGNEKEEGEKDMDEEGGEGEDEEEEEGGLGADPRAMDSASDDDSDDEEGGVGPAIPQLKTAAQSFFEDM
jgi:WD40 repeat protein